MNIQHYCRKNDVEIQRRIDRGIWRPSLDTGHIYSTETKHNLKENKTNCGYLTVGDKKEFHVSRVIWIAAHGIPEAGLEIDHINANKEDNRLQNLQLITPQENTARSSSALTFADAEEIRKLHKKGISKRKLADKYFVSPRTIGRIIAYKSYKTAPPHEILAIRAKEEIARIGTDAVEEIISTYALGASIRQISNRYKITETTVRTILRGEA
ncbi:MAG: HNH endonuclease [Methanocorpusculum sp.]|nr:HNH endonuclease [Methanocorpusculum sp.]